MASRGHYLVHPPPVVEVEGVLLPVRVAGVVPHRGEVVAVVLLAGEVPLMVEAGVGPQTAEGLEYPGGHRCCF